MHFVSVSCGYRADFGRALVKSMVLFSSPDDVIVLHAFVKGENEVTLLGNMLDEVSD